MELTHSISEILKYLCLQVVDVMRHLTVKPRQYRDDDKDDDNDSDITPNYGTL